MACLWAITACRDDVGDKLPDGLHDSRDDTSSDADTSVADTSSDADTSVADTSSDADTSVADTSSDADADSLSDTETPSDDGTPDTSSNDGTPDTSSADTSLGDISSDGTDLPPSDVIHEPRDPFEVGVAKVTLVLEPIARGLLVNDPSTSVPARLAFEGFEPIAVRVSLPASDSQRDFGGKPTFSVRFEPVPQDPPYAGLAGVGLLSMVGDPSHMRVRLVTHLAGRLGLEVPRATYARLTLEGGDEGALDLGLYTMTEALTSSAYLERAVGALATHSIFEPRDRGDLWPWQIADLGLVLGDESDRAALITLSERLETFRKAHLSGEPLTLADALEGAVDLSAFAASMAFDIAVGHTVGYARNVWQFALHVRDGRVTFLPKQLGASLEAGDIPNPWYGGGKLLWHCRDDADCRVLLGEKLSRLASLLSTPELLAEASAIRFLALSELSTDARREADDETVAAAQDAVLQTLAERGPWLSDNLPCADPAAVDRDGDGASACTTDCDDDRADVHPGALEQCNLRDDDCDGVLDDDPSCEPCVLVDGPYDGTKWALCYRPLNWVSAREDCISRAGELVSVTSEFEHMTFLRRVFGLQWVSWWMGLSDLETEGSFVWADGQPVTWTRWNEGEPNDYGGREDCAEFMPWGGGLWNDLPCDRALPYVCALP